LCWDIAVLESTVQAPLPNRADRTGSESPYLPMQPRTPCQRLAATGAFATEESDTVHVSKSVGAAPSRAAVRRRKVHAGAAVLRAVERTHLPVRRSGARDSSQ